MGPLVSHSHSSESYDESLHRLAPASAAAPPTQSPLSSPPASPSWPGLWLFCPCSSAWSSPVFWVSFLLCLHQSYSSFKTQHRPCINQGPGKKLMTMHQKGWLKSTKEGTIEGGGLDTGEATSDAAVLGTCWQRGAATIPGWKGREEGAFTRTTREPRLQAGATPSLEELGPPGREEARETQRPALSSCRLPPAAAQLGQTQLAGGRHDVLLASCPYRSEQQGGGWSLDREGPHLLLGAPLGNPAQNAALFS